MFSRQVLRSFASRSISPRSTQFVKPINNLRFYSFSAESQPRIRIGSEAPNFVAETTKGKINFHEFVGDSWVVLFSHPADFTPVCTTELGAFARLEPDFTKRNVKLIGLSTEGVESHLAWIKDIEDVTSGGSNFSYPIIADSSKEVAFKYDMITEEDFKKLDSGMIATVRSVFVIDPAKKVRLIMTYPASTGRNSAEVLRVVDALQLADKRGVATPINWTVGEDVIIPPTVSDEAAKEKFGEFTTLKPYLRYTKSE